jgi:hypothetical protein
VIPLDQLHFAKKLNVQVVGYTDVSNLNITYGYKFTNISGNFEPLIMSKKSFSPRFDDGTPFHKSTGIRGLDLDSAREMAIGDIKSGLKDIIGGRRLKHPMEIICEMIVAAIKEIASSARMFCDKSLEPLWKFGYGIYDAKEYYGAFK